MKKTNSTEEVLGWLSRARGRVHSIGGPKGIQSILEVFLAIFERSQGTLRKIVWNIRRWRRREAIRILIGLIPVESQIRPVLLKKDLCSVLKGESWKEKYSDAWLLILGRTHHTCPKKEWFSTYKPYDRGSVLMGNDTVCKTVGIGNIFLRMFW